MSDIDGRDAFDNILDRLEAAACKAEREEAKADKWESQARTFQAERDRWQKAAAERNDEIGKLHSRIDRMKALLLPDQAAALAALPSPDDTNIPF